MTTLPLTSLVTLLITLLMFATSLNVGRNRARYGIKPPLVTGHEMFERAYRIQMNTLENTVQMLPGLWICAAFIGDRTAALIGAVWLIARIWYAVGYQSNPSKRIGGFALSTLSFASLWVGALWGVLRSLA